MHDSGPAFIRDGKPVPLTPEDERKLRRAMPACFKLVAAAKLTQDGSMKLRWLLQVDTPRSGRATMVLRSRGCPDVELRRRMEMLIPNRAR